MVISTAVFDGYIMKELFPVVCCDHSKLTRDTGWMHGFPIDEILTEVPEERRNQPSA